MRAWWSFPRARRRRPAAARSAAPRSARPARFRSFPSRVLRRRPRRLRPRHRRRPRPAARSCLSAGSSIRAENGHMRGFTLIELVITVAIVALLASIALPVTELAVQRTKEQELHRSLREIREAIDGYKQAADEGRVRKSINESGYPKKLEQLVEGVDDEKSPKKEKIYFLRR